MKKDYIIVDSQIIKTLMNAGVSNYGAIILYSKINSMSKNSFKWILCGIIVYN